MKLIMFGALFTSLSACLTADVKVDIDEDEDGLTLVQEEEIGTDPNNPDSDGDGFDDGNEQASGTDPLDENAHPYTGGYLVDTCSGSSDGITEGYAIGQRSPDWSLIDQHGEEVTLSDFCGSVVLLETSAFW